MEAQPPQESGRVGGKPEAYRYVLRHSRLRAHFYGGTASRKKVGESTVSRRLTAMCCGIAACGPPMRPGCAG